MPRLTSSGKKTKIADFEDKVDASKLPGGKREKFAIANKIGLMHGNKATARGASAAKAKASPLIRGNAKPSGSMQDRQK